MKKMIVTCILEYNNIDNAESEIAEKIIQNLNLKVTQGLIQDATNSDNVNVEDVEIIGLKKYSDFVKWLSTCPVRYEVDDLKGFDDDSIVFLTSESTDKHEN